MMKAFVIWSLVSALLLGIGVSAWRSKNPVGFFAGVKPPDVRDTGKYNHSVAILWFVYAILLEICGMPLLFLAQNSAGIILVVMGVVVITIAMMIMYFQIEKKYRLP